MTYLPGVTRWMQARAARLASAILVGGLLAGFGCAGGKGKPKTEPTPAAVQTPLAQPATSRERTLEVVAPAIVLPEPPATTRLFADDFATFKPDFPGPYAIELIEGVSVRVEPGRGNTVAISGVSGRRVGIARQIRSPDLATQLLRVRVRARYLPRNEPGTPTSGGAIMELTFGGESRRMSISPGDEFTPVELSAVVPAEAATCVLFIGLDSAAGQLSLDDLMAWTEPATSSADLASVAPGTTRNLITGGDFEFPPQQLGVGVWRTIGGATVPARTVATLAADAPVGARALRLDTPAGVWGLSTGWIQLAPGQPYTLSFFARATAPLAMRADVVSASRRRLGQQLDLTPAWQRFVVDLPADWREQLGGAALDCVHIQLSSTGPWPGDASVWLDGLMLERGPELSPLFVDADPMPVALTFGREMNEDVSNLFRTGEETVARVSVINRTEQAFLTAGTLTVRDGFGRARKWPVAINVPALGHGHITVALDLGPGAFVATVELTPPVERFGTVPPARAQRQFSVLATAGGSALPANSADGGLTFALPMFTQDSAASGLLGGQVLQVNVPWSAAEPDRRTYDFGPWLPAIEGARRRGQRVWAVLGQTLHDADLPAGYAGAELPEFGSGRGETLATPFSDFAFRAIRTLGQAGASEYQAFDQAGPFGRHVALPPRAYLLLLKLLNTQIEVNQPAARSVASLGVIGPAREDEDIAQYLIDLVAADPRLAQARAAVRLDPAAELEPERVIPALLALARLRTSYGMSGMYDSGFGSNAGSAYTPATLLDRLLVGRASDRPADPALEAALVARHALLRAGGGFARIVWNAPIGSLAHPALSSPGVTWCDVDGTLRPPAVAYAVLANQLAGATPIAITPLTARAGYVGIFRLASGELLIAVWRTRADGFPPARPVEFAVRGVSQVIDVFGQELARPDPAATRVRITPGVAPVYIITPAESGEVMIESLRGITEPITQ